MGDLFPPSHENQSLILHSQIVVGPTIPIPILILILVPYLRSKHHQSFDSEFRFCNPASKRTITVLFFFKCARLYPDLHNMCTPNYHNFLIFNVQLIRAVPFSGPRLHKKLAFWVYAFFVQSVNFTLGSCICNQLICCSFMMSLLNQNRVKTLIDQEEEKLSLE